MFLEIKFVNVRRNSNKPPNKFANMVVQQPWKLGYMFAGMGEKYSSTPQTRLTYRGSCK